MYRLVCIFLVLSGCSTFQDNDLLRDSLANRGPVTLSKSNPYIAANKLLTKEVAANATLKGFLRVRGNPDALEVKKVLLRPYTLYFFYLAKKEVFILEDSNKDWIIRGPQRIPDKVLKGIHPLIVEKTAPLELAASDLAVDESIADNQPTESEAPAAAENDIQHIVQFQGETLRLIADWYTGTPDNMQKLARINDLENPNALAMGQTIRIPRYLVTNGTPLTKKRVEDYRR